MSKTYRQHVEERDSFTYDEKQLIAMKSDDRCCHCGRKCFFGYGATIDHFVPISKGGTNDDANLIMMCYDCNQEKGKSVVEPSYVPYLKEEEKKKLIDYWRGYLESYEHISRKNLLYCDLYEINVDVTTPYVGRRRESKVKSKGFKHIMKRATEEDIDKLTEYFILYLTKYNRLDSPKTARANIEFWLKFGCIYYVEKGGEIKVMSAITVTDTTDNDSFEGWQKEGYSTFLTLSVFSRYNTEYAQTLVYGLYNSILEAVVTENDIWRLPVRISTLAEDKMNNILCYHGKLWSENGNCFMHVYLLKEGPGKSKKAQAEFFDKFYNVERGFDHWIKERGYEEEVGWMRTELKMLPDNLNTDYDNLKRHNKKKADEFMDKVKEMAVNE